MGCRSRKNLLILFLLAATQLSDALATQSLPIQKIESRWKRLRQRQSDETNTPSAISIAPSQYWEGDDGPWSSFPVQVGSGSVGGLQNVRVMPATAATAIWTIGADGCPADFGSTCPNSRGALFLPNQSLTWVPNSVYQTGLEMNLGMDTSGSAGFDVATLGWQGSGGPTVERSIVWNLASGTYWLGVFGLNPRPTNFTTFTDPQISFMQTLVNHKKIPSTSWGYTAGNQYRLDKVYGSLTLGGYDSNRFIPNNLTFDFFPDISRDLSVNVQSITTSQGSPSNLLPDGSISIFIDSTVPELWLPESACTAFESAFGIEYNDNYGRYLITATQREKLLAQNAEVKFTLGTSVTGGKNVDITLPYQAFDLQVNFPIVMNPNTSYYFPLQKAANDTQYTLGRTFLQEAYVIADYERMNFSVSQCRWEQDKVSTQSIVDILSPNAAAQQGSDGDDSATLSTAAVAGVAVGGVVLVAIFGLAFFFIRRRRNTEKRRFQELEEKDSKAGSPSDANRSQANISAPIGGELGGGDIHEMPHQGHIVQEIDGPYGGDPNKIGFSEMEGQAYFGHGKGFANEMPANYAVYEMDGKNYDVYEMAGSEVQEMPAKRFSRMSEAREMPSERFSRTSKESRSHSRSGWL